MSGLTLGILSLDKLNLRLLVSVGSEREKYFAGRILPLVEKEHLLLVTLLLWNAVAMEGLPLALDRIVPSYLAIIISVTAVLLFGEVIPQGVCSRYGLVIGAYASPIVRFLMALAFPISWPISKLLDLILGKSHAGFFRRAEFKELVRMHGEEHKLTGDEVSIIRGALELREKTALQVMTPLDSVFMASADRVFDASFLDELYEKAHSRIPVYEKGDRKNVIGLLIVKTLIKSAGLAFSDDGLAKRITVGQLPLREPLHVPSHMPLDQLLNKFQQGRSHMALVFQSYDLVGVVTLEDVLEELIAEEIVDETDVYVDVHKKIRVVRAIVDVKSSVSDRNGNQSIANNQPKSGGWKKTGGANPMLPIRRLAGEDFSEGVSTETVEMQDVQPLEPRLPIYGASSPSRVRLLDDQDVRVCQMW
eukprot:ANDGO_06872.mRNA.1 DUF21 domain-containing protein At2g14520